MLVLGHGLLLAKPFPMRVGKQIFWVAQAAWEAQRPCHTRSPDPTLVPPSLFNPMKDAIFTPNEARTMHALSSPHRQASREGRLEARGRRPSREQDAEEPILDVPPKYGDPEP